MGILHGLSYTAPTVHLEDYYIHQSPSRTIDLAVSNSILKKRNSNFPLRLFQLRTLYDHKIFVLLFYM